MATIKSQMVLNDGMSAVLRRITTALDLTLHSFEQVQRVSGQAVDTAGIEQAHSALAGANLQLDGMAEGFRQAAKQEEKLNHGIREGAGAAEGLLNKVVALVSAYASISAMKNTVTDALQAADIQINAQVQLRTTLDSMGVQGAYQEILDKAGEIQGRGMYGDEAMIAGAAEFSTYLSEGEAILSMMDTLTDYAAGMSGGGEVDPKQMVDYATQLGKVLNGTFDGIAKKGFQVSEAQEQILKTGTDMEKAAVVADIINESWAGMYEAMSSTPQGQLIALKNSLGDLKEDFGAGLYPAVLEFVGVIQAHMPEIEQLVQGLTQVLGGVISLVAQGAERAIAFGSAFLDTWPDIAPYVTGVGMAILVCVLATKAWAIAQGIFNGVMLANPVLLILGAIVAAIYVVTSLVNKATGSTISATGLVAAAFFTLGANILNHSVIPVQNAFANFVNFLGNAFNDPAAAVKVLIYDMCMDSLRYVSAMTRGIESLINRIPGVQVDISSGLDSFYRELEQAQQAVKDKSGWVEYVGKLDYIDPSQAADAGYRFGKGLEDTLKDFSLGSIEDYSNGLGGQGAQANLAAIADNTGAMAEGLELGQEELAYMRDIAERDSINRFTTAEVKIDMTGMSNRIEGGADLDGVISALTGGFTEALLTAAEGVHA